MILKMKKLTFLVTNKECESFLEDIRKIGVVQIDELQSGATSPELQEHLETAERIKSALKNLDFAEKTYAVENEEFKALPADSEKGIELLDEIEKLLEEENKTKHELDATNNDIQALTPWGEFDSSEVKKLELAGYKLSFYTCRAKKLSEDWTKESNAVLITSDGDRLYFVTLTPLDSEVQINAEKLTLPTGRLSEYKEKAESLNARIEEIHNSLYRLSVTERASLLSLQADTDNSITLDKVHLSPVSVADNAVKLFVGWVPEENEEKIIQYLDTSHIFYQSEKPTAEDDVPIKLKLNAYDKLFEPIQKMYSLPNYQDLDIVPFMAPFFMLFFGMCMCDAGYGAIILAASLAARKKMKGEMKGYAGLGIVLGAMTIVCGLLTGSVFGIDLSKSEWAIFAPFKEYFINGDNYSIFGYSPMMIISVVIGFIQVLVGMVLAAVKAAKQSGWQYGIGKMSWVIALLTAVACYGLPACGVALSAGVTYALDALLILSVIGIFFLNTPKRGILKTLLLNPLTGLWDTYGMATGLLGDLLSYIRLFALGLTGGVLGGVFNQLAIEMSADAPNIVVRAIIMILILLFGHGINFALCMISSFVHPMRLTFVEFFKNANFEGGGREYDPFRIKKFKSEE